jgi:hypothetical protein
MALSRGGFDPSALIGALGGGGGLGFRPITAADLLPFLVGPQFPQSVRAGASLSGSAAPGFNASQAVLPSAFANAGSLVNRRSQGGTPDFLSQIMQLLGGPGGGASGAGGTSDILSQIMPLLGGLGGGASGAGGLSDALTITQALGAI